MNNPKIADFTYDLPDHKISKQPAFPRDTSKVLVYKNNNIEDLSFSHLPAILPPNTLLIYNNTKVIQARLFFKNSYGATIQLFCLNPINKPIQEAMLDLEVSYWECLVGNAAKFRETNLELTYFTENKNYTLTAIKEEKNNQTIIKFTWTSSHNFAEILNLVGNVPLPPYFKREATQDDYENYQTVFAKYKGSVAAPTAGLHFTEQVVQGLKLNACHFAEVTLHVGAGTFMPVKAINIAEHSMHAEEFLVERTTIEKLILQSKNIAAVGTTSLRTLESLYWLGLQLHLGKKIDAENCFVSQWEPYKSTTIVSKEQILAQLLNWMKDNEIVQLRGKTQILITPGYTFKIVDILITNFHLPQSTLLLLVAAFTNGNWKPIYEHALSSNYRFLSYGDSSVLFRNKM